MRIFISEFVCGGGWPGDLPGSLAREGEAMLRAIVEDFSRIDGVRVTTTWDRRLGEAPFENAHTILIDSPDDELPIFRELAGLCDATLIVAPEIDGILALRARIAAGAGARLLGPDVAAIELCADKLRLARHWESNGINTVPTYELQESTPVEFPIVLKPRDGAGSQGVQIIADAREWNRLDRNDLSQRGYVWQPFFPGRAVSCALFVPEDGVGPLCLPPADQRLSTDGRLTYQGGRIPSAHGDPTAIQREAARACAVVPGLRGYVGVDLIVRESASEAPIPVEINPRLTTSYVGYRRLAMENLARQFDLGAITRPPLGWRPGFVEFDASGTLVSVSG